MAAAGEGGLATRTRTAIEGFVGLVTRLRARVGLLALPELLDLVLEESGYRAMLIDGSQEGEDRWANLLELREVVDRYADLAPEDALDRLADVPTVVMCGHGERAMSAASLLTRHGLTKVSVLDGGPEDWAEAHGQQLETGP